MSVSGNYQGLVTGFCYEPIETALVEMQEAEGGWVVVSTLSPFTTVFSFITVATDTALGLVAGVFSLCTLGLEKRSFNFAVKEFRQSEQILSLPLKNLLAIIHPSEVCVPLQESSLGTSHRYRIENFSNIPASILKGLIQNVFGVLATAGSFLACGQWSYMNQTAERYLRVTVLGELFIGLIQTINPNAV